MTRLSIVLVTLCLFQAGVTTTTRRPPQKPATSVTRDVKDMVDKYYMCQYKCKGHGEKLECGVNGWWFHNKCQRECEGVALSLTEKECDKNEKNEFETYYNCHVECEGVGGGRECGADGVWYEDGCRMGCYKIPKANKTVCEKLDKVAECADKCVGEGVALICGGDGDWYDNECHMNCSGVEVGVEGKDCETRVNLAKYWECQDKCKDKMKKEECGVDGYYYFNSCHRECYGAKLGVKGKDCAA